jgi:hypothetical protein
MGKPFSQQHKRLNGPRRAKCPKHIGHRSALFFYNSEHILTSTSSVWIGTIRMEKRIQHVPKVRGTIFETKLVLSISVELFEEGNRLDPKYSKRGMDQMK